MANTELIQEAMQAIVDYAAAAEKIDALVAG